MRVHGLSGALMPNSMAISLSMCLSGIPQGLQPSLHPSVLPSENIKPHICGPQKVHQQDALGTFNTQIRICELQHILIWQHIGPRAQSDSRCNGALTELTHMHDGKDAWALMLACAHLRHRWPCMSVLQGHVA